MKTEKDMRNSRRARLNQIIRNSLKLHETANREWCRGNPRSDRIAAMRDLAGEIMQGIHEYSAYSTALEDIEPGSVSDNIVREAKK